MISQGDQSQPVLADGYIAFASARDFLDTFAKTLSRGAVAVRSQENPEPLTEFSVRIHIAGWQQTVLVQVQVVSSRDGVLLVNIVDPQGDTLQELASFAEELEQATSNPPEPATQKPKPIPEQQLAAGMPPLTPAEEIARTMSALPQVTVQTPQATPEQQSEPKSGLLPPPPQDLARSPQVATTPEQMAATIAAIMEAPAAATPEPPPVVAPGPPAVVAPEPPAATEPPAVIAPEPPPVVAPEPPAATEPPAVIAPEPPGVVAPEPPAATAVVVAPEPPSVVAPEPPAAATPEPPVVAPEPPAAVPPQPPAVVAPEQPAVVTPEQPATEAPVPAVTPEPQTPIFRDTTITLAQSCLKNVQAEVEKTGGLMAKVEGTPPVFGSLTIQLQVAETDLATQLTTDVVFAQGDQVALVFTDPATATATIARWQQPADSQTPVATASRSANKGVTISKRPLHNPDSPPALLQLNIAAPPDPRETDRPNIFEMIYALGRLRALGTLTIRHDDESLELPFRVGAMLISEEDRQKILLAGTKTSGTIEMTPTLPDRIKSDKRPRDPRGVVADALRRTLREHRAEELELGLSSVCQLFPVPAPQVAPSLFGLKLDAKEARFLDVVLDGTRCLSDLPRVSGMLKPTTFRFFYILHAYRLWQLNEDAVYDPAEDPKKLFTAECNRLLANNPFELLGVHWSEHPNQIRDKYQRRKQRYASSSPMAKHNPDLASKVRQAMEKAFGDLSSREGRRDARKQLGPIDQKSAADILARHAELASIREEFRVVKECLEMALELHPSQEHKSMAQRLLKS